MHKPKTFGLGLAMVLLMISSFSDRLLASEAALPLPNITINLFDTFGDGWNGATWTVFASNGTFIQSGTLASGSSGTANLTLTDGCYSITVTEGGYPSEISWSITGPVTPATLQGNSPANVSFVVGSGNCDPEIGYGMATFEMIDSFGDGWNGATYTFTNSQGQILSTGTLAQGLFGTQSFFMGEGCFTLVVTGGSFPSEISWNLYYDADPMPELSGTAPYNNTICNYTGTPGCMDVDACNFDPLATVDDSSCCYDQCVHIEMGGGFSNSGNSFTLFSSDPDAVLTGSLPYDEVVCLPADCFYLLFMSDNQGDGWNNSTYSFSDAVTGEVWCTGSMDQGAGDYDQISIGYVLGCTDITANNYNPMANCNNQQCCDGNTITIKEYDYGGDGWEGCEYYLFTDGDVFVAAGKLENGDLGEDLECIPNGCYKITITTASPSAQELWFDVFLGDSLLVHAPTAAGAWPFYEFCVNEEEPGCMNNSSCNFDPEATVSLPGCCENNCVQINVFNDVGTAETYWELLDENGVVVTTSEEPSLYTACLVDGCYTFQFVAGHYIGYTTYEFIHLNTGDTLLSGTTGPGTNDVHTFCVYEGTGCTDITACNFSPDASNDDGTCCYGACAQLKLFDTGNDGWEGSSIILKGPTGNLFSGSIISGDSLVVDICLDDACYGITGYGTWDNESYWLIKVGEEILISGIPGEYYQGEFQIGTPTPGCTDPVALNYDPLAGCDDCACEYVCKSDFNHDNAINIADFLVFMSSFDCEVMCCRYDLTGEGEINIADLLIFTSEFGTTCN